MNKLIFAAATASASILTSEDYEFMSFVTKHNKSYGTTAEFEFRSNIFKGKLAEINNLNANQNTATYGVNEFTDRTPQEMSKMIGYKSAMKTHGDYKSLDTKDLAATVDWRTKGAVTPVKNQGQCGSCWAFSTTGSIEGATFIKDGVLTSLSEQQLVDCAGSYGNNGCQGGLMDNAFKYAEKNPLETEATYEYTGQDDQCKYVSAKGVTTVVGYTDVPAGDVKQFMAAVAKQPVSIAIEADQAAFQSFTGGVITSGCGTQLDHGVLCVGYGTENGTLYALVKNSWGPAWGESGFVKIGLTNNQCGILNSASYPQV